MTKLIDRRGLMLCASAAAFAPTIALSAEKRPKTLVDQATAAGVLSGSGRPVLSPGSTIHIPTFRLEIVNSVSETAQTTGFAAGGRATQSSTYTLTNIDAGQVAMMTTALYDALVAELRAQGHTVAAPDATRADPDLGPLMAGQPSPLGRASTAGQSMFFAPRGMDVVIEPMDPSSASTTGFGAFAETGPAMQRALAVNRAVTRRLAVIQPKYTLGFVSLSSNTEGFGGRFTDIASVSADIGLRIMPETTRWDAMVPADTRAGVLGGHFLVDTPLLVPGQAFTNAVNATPAAQNQANAVANILGLGIASVTGSTNNYNANTRAVQPTPLFQPLAQEALLTVQKAMTARVTTGR